LVFLPQGRYTKQYVSLAGVNNISIIPDGGAKVVRINVEGWQNNQMNLLSLETNAVR
jgi:hypothetical protein